MTTPSKLPPADPAPAGTVIPVPARVVKGLLYSVPALLALATLLILAVLFRGPGSPEPEPQLVEQVRQTSDAVAEVRSAVHELSDRVSKLPTKPDESLATAVADARTKVVKLEGQFGTLSKTLNNYGMTLAGTAANATQATDTAGEAKKAADGAAKTAGEAASAADRAAKTAGEAQKTADTAAAAAKGAAKPADVKNAVEATATQLKNSLVQDLGGPQKVMAEQLQGVIARLDHLTARNQLTGTAADVAVVISHGARCDAAPLKQVAADAFDKNPVRSMFANFRLAVFIESNGKPLDGKPLLDWPTDSNKLPKLDATRELQKADGRVGEPGAVDPAALFPAGATARRCVFVTHPSYPPPKPDAEIWKGVAADAVLIVPAGEAGKADTAAWTAFCRAHGGMAVVFPGPDDPAKWPDPDRAALAALLRRLTAPY